MNRRDFIKLSMAGTTLSAWNTACSTKKPANTGTQRPNILFLFGGCITNFFQNLSCGISEIPVLIKSVTVKCGSDGEDIFGTFLGPEHARLLGSLADD